MTSGQLLLCLLAACLLGGGLGWSLARRRRGALPQPASPQPDLAPAVLLDAFPDAFFIVDHDDLILHANQAAIALFGQPVLTGRPILETLGDARLAAPYLECRATGRPAAQQIALPAEAHPGRTQPAAGGGESLWLVDAAGVVGTGQTPRIRLLLRDLSAGHRLDQIRQDFVANASHELRTPITLVDGYLETLLDTPELMDNRESALRYLGIMRKHTVRIARIIEDMLLISRIEAGEASTLKIESFSLQQSIHDILDRLEPLIRNQQAEVKIALHDSAAIMHADRFYWAQILFNLIENALKQNPQPGLRVVIRSEADAQNLHIEVVDHGIGIPAADLPFIFKRFYRVAKHHSQNEVKGTGLGLSIVKRAVEAHGGTILCESAPGIRTVFRITMPDPPAGQGEDSPSCSTHMIQDSR